MYEQDRAGMSLPQNNLQFIQNKATKKMSGRQLRRMINRRNKTNKTNFSYLTNLKWDFSFLPCLLSSVLILVLSC